MARAGKQYRKIYSELRRIFSNENVIDEWDVAKNAEDWMREREHLYAPRIDFAIGPFNITNTVEANTRSINAIYSNYEDFITRLKEKDLVQTAPSFDQNRNPRCFMAIEIEKTTSRKHRLGSIVNVSALGKIGIVIGTDNKVSNSLVNLKNFLIKTDELGKSTVTVNNVIVLTKSDFLKVLKQFDMISGEECKSVNIYQYLILLVVCQKLKMN